MLIKTPHSLHYPITVTELLKKRNEDVKKFEPLFAYAYKSTVTEGNEYGEEFTVEKTFPARFESETDGVVASWKVAKGAVIAGPG
jgi:RNA polymerase II subunit A-like phosphatase